MGGSQGPSRLIGAPLTTACAPQQATSAHPMTSRVTYTFSSDQAGPQTLYGGEGAALGTLREHLQECINDSATPAVELVSEVSQRAQEWVFAQRLTWSHEDAAASLEEALCALDEAHGWRGVLATWIDQVRGTMAWAKEREDLSGPRSPLAEEMGLWLDADGSLRGQTELLTPLCDAPRVVPARSLAPHVLRELQPGETILMIGWSPELVECSRAAYRAGLAPEVLVAEGRPGLAGRGMTRDVASAGLRARLVLDAGLWEAAREADRVWVATESVGEAHTTAQLGVSGVMELCLQEEIPMELFATTDACHPSGVGAAAPTGDPDRVWGDRPEGVEVDAQYFESVPTSAFTRWYCEHGARRPASHEWPDRPSRPEPCAATRSERDLSVETKLKETEADRA